jgi:hypothetical protein
MYALTPTNVLLTSHFVKANSNDSRSQHAGSNAATRVISINNVDSWKAGLNVTSGAFPPFNEDKQVVRGLPEGRILVSGIKLDGQYIIMVTPPKNI